MVPESKVSVLENATVSGRTYAGIDPGDSGAIAFIDSEGRFMASYAFTSWDDMLPHLKLFQRSQNILIGLEQVHSFPGMNAKAMTTFMVNYGGWKALLEVLKIPYIDIPPQRWQRSMLGIIPKGQSKPRALRYANKQWPQCKLVKKKDEGIIDALCIAAYTRREHLSLK